MQLWQVMKRPPSMPVALALLTISYAGMDLLLNKFAIGIGWTILWPLNGITIAILLRIPRKQWPWLLLAIEAGTGLGECLNNYGLRREALERVWSTSEVVLSALLLPRFISIKDWLAQPRIVLRVALSLSLGPALSGLLAAGEFHFVYHEPFGSAWNWWTTPDMLGCAVTLPMALTCFTPEMRLLFTRSRLGETLSVLSLNIAVTLLIFSVGSYPLLFLLYPALLYVDSKLSFAGAAIAMLTSSVIGVFCTVHGLGPFGHWSPALVVSRETALQIYLGFHALALLPLSLLIMERQNMSAQLQKANERLLALSQQDALTGIANRRAFDEGLADAWNQALKKQMPLSLLMIDIDSFKQYNDCHGHLEGDRCLVRVAEVLSNVARRENNCVARFGGEEFAVLLPNSEADACLRMAEMLRKAVVFAAIAHEESSWGLVTISVGCASVLPASATDPLTLVKEADKALYRAKELGRNRLESPIAHVSNLRDLFRDASQISAVPVECFPVQA